MNNFCLWKKWARDGWISPHAFTWACVCVPTLQRRADVAEHEIGPLVTNTWPLIFTSHFSFFCLSHFLRVSPSSALPHPPPPPTLHHILVSPFSLSISFSLHTLSIFNNILNPTLHFLGLSPLLLPRPHYLFFLLSHSQADAYFSKFSQSFKNTGTLCALCPSLFKHRMSQSCSTTVLWLAAQLTRISLPFHALLFTLRHLATLFDVSSRCSHPSIMAVRS